VDRHSPLPAALRLTHAQQPAFEIDVVPVEPEITSSISCVVTVRFLAPQSPAGSKLNAS
jgi:hypothetical protein